MITEEARRKRIIDALNAYHQQSGPKETMTLSWRGHQKILQVIQLDLDCVLLNSNSHRIRAQLEDHSQKDIVRDQPWEDSAQEVIADLLRKAHEDFEILKASLLQEGQREPGFITRDGILINANTRAVALRQLADADKRWIRVAVLPADAEPKELAELELRLQVQKELKEPYSLTNELLFIEDMARTYHKQSQQIASDLRWTTTKDAKDIKRGEQDVEQRRRILASIREMQQVATPPIELTFFDDKLEQLKALEAKYSALVSENPGAARRFRDNWLCAARAGSSSVHDLRAVDEDFAEDFLRPRLAEDEYLARVIDDLLAPSKANSKPLPPGVDLLDPGDHPPPPSETDVRRLLNAFSTSGDVTLDVGGKRVVLDGDRVREAIRTATKGAIKDFKAEDKAQDRLDAPGALLRDVVTRLRKARVAWRNVRNDPQFTQARRSKLEYQLKQARKALSELDSDLQSR